MITETSMPIPILIERVREGALPGREAAAINEAMRLRLQRWREDGDVANFCRSDCGASRG